MKTTEIKQVTVEGIATAKDKAISLALNNIQKQIVQDDQAIIIRIEPVEVDVVEAYCEEWMEKFLFFFAAQKRTKYYVKLNVKVQVTILDVNSIQFSKRK